jgi:uncharacterized protein YjiS (DUF1127 family)
MSTQRLIQFQLQGLIRQGIARAPMPLIKALAQAIVRWRRQRQRTSLAQLDDRMLRDMGISRLEAERESRKPFWRD